jgi:hypothetical protein
MPPEYIYILVDHGILHDFSAGEVEGKLYYALNNPVKTEQRWACSGRSKVTLESHRQTASAKGIAIKSRYTV